MNKPSILARFSAISMLMQIKQSMLTVGCLCEDNDNTQDTLDFLCEKLSDMSWVSDKFQFIDDSSSLSTPATQALEGALSSYLAGVDLPWTETGLEFTTQTLKNTLFELSTPVAFHYISGTAVYLDNLQGSTFGSLYGDLVSRTVAFFRLGDNFEYLEKTLLEISSFQATVMVNLALNNHPYTADNWLVVTLDTMATPVLIDVLAAYRSE